METENNFIIFIYCTTNLVNNNIQKKKIKDIVYRYRDIMGKILDYWKRFHHKQTRRRKNTALRRIRGNSFE